MKIKAEDSLEVHQHLQAEMSAGNTWMAYNTTETFVKKQDLHCFSGKEEANEFCEDNISDHDSMLSIPIKPVLDAITETLIQRNGAQQLTPAPISLEIRFFIDTINSSTLNTAVMNQKNFEYLKDQIKF